MNGILKDKSGLRLRARGVLWMPPIPVVILGVLIAGLCAPPRGTYVPPRGPAFEDVGPAAQGAVAAPRQDGVAATPHDAEPPEACASATQGEEQREQGESRRLEGAGARARCSETETR
jgi:hypothetical protein